MTNKDNYQLKTLGRGLEVLALLKAAPGPVTLSALSRQLGEPTTVVFRILKTLEACGQIRQDGTGKAYGTVMQPQDDGATVERTLATVRALGEAYPGTVSAAELATLFACQAADLAGLLRALCREGVIEQSREGYWRLAHGCLALAAPLIGQDDLAADLQPIMEALRRETRETVLLYRISGERQTVVVSLPSPQPIRYVLGVGSAFPLYLGAGGKVALAYMPAADARRYLEQADLVSSTDYVPEANNIQLMLSRIRHDGYAITLGERVEGAAGVAVPICGPQGQLEAVISIVLPAFRTDRAQLERMATQLRRTLADAGYRADAGS
ncbi:IclR family transcriptional regulator domain-containing protein [Marinobacterium rhizophilum]|uniref:HTH-type transcriptional repressor AllR n=1 Tax=Marinobacterium rhizophilum TaxID=420402 RepID=A0ABY5HLW4_9GAMM|nr:IclR family transcriptional regulator C-terminal domain-containing protein [Marinobacterium rhizophilum]UTW12588.1 helix-turn-helix domain-containing protein [Marinobacterium rhizophilum]